MNPFVNCMVTEFFVLESDMLIKPNISVSGRPFNSLSYRLSGRTGFSCAERTFISQPDSVTFVKAGVPYQTEVEENGHILVVHFRTSKPLVDAPDMCVFTPRNSVLMKNIFLNMRRLFAAEGALSPACLALFYEALAELELPHEDDRIGRRMAIIRDHIENHFSDPALSVQALAEIAGVSEVCLRRQFRQYFNRSPGEYIRLVRHKNAKAMLKTGYFTVSETCASCGYSSLSYFSYEFSRVEGISPARYARRYADHL